MKKWKTMGWKWLKRALLFFAVAFGCFLLINWFWPLPDQIEYSTIITDNKGQVIHAYLTHDQKWRMKTALNEISPILRKTIVQKEDKYFYAHPGINALAVGRAFFRNLLKRKRTSGASTITMQVARALEPKRRTYFNKVIEMFRALQLEWKYSKEEILQLYVNLVPYGGNIEGVKAAAILYFSKNPDHLSLAEVMALSIIPNRPSSLVIGKNNDLIVKERNKWLHQFAAEKLFSEKEITDALSEPLTASRGTVPQWLPQLCQKLKRQGGDIIETAIDLNMQFNVETLVRDQVRTLRLKNIRNAAVIVIDNQTHNVVSYVGSADFADSSDAGQVNGASAIRQPGSTLKPLLYALSIDAGQCTPKTVLTDVPVNYDGYAPENYDRQFNGYVTMEYALEHSLNIPAVKALRLYGKDHFIQKLATCHFEQVRKDQRKLGLSLILGGCGARLEELTGMYSVFAQEGRFFKPNLTRRPGGVKDSGVQVISPAACFMINQILSKVNRPDFPLHWQSTEHMPRIAWKTGTSYGHRDAWSIGYNRRYTVGVWVGNFSAQGIPELSGANTATPLLFKIFNNIDYDSDESWFTQPADCAERVVCSETGLVPAEQCTNRVSDYFIPLVSSTQSCDNRQQILVSADEKISYCAVCRPAAGFKKKWVKVVAPDMMHYFEERKIAYEHIPPHNPACEKVFVDGIPVITSPRSGSEYLLSRKKPEPLQLTCNVSNDATMVFWYINDHFYKSAAANSKQFFIPEEGPVKISCTDDKGRNRNVWIRVKLVDL